MPWSRGCLSIFTSGLTGSARGYRGGLHAWPPIILGGLAGPAFTLAVGAGALAMHLKLRTAQGLNFAVAVANLAAHPVGILTFVLPLAFGASGVGIDTDEAIVAALLPATSALKEEVMERVGVVDFHFLLKGWSFLVIWVYLALHTFLWWLLVFRGKPLGRPSRMFSAVAVLIVILASGLYGSFAPGLWRTFCF